MIDTLVNRYSWLVGLYIAAGGLTLFFFGIITNQMGNIGNSSQTIHTEFGPIRIDDIGSPFGQPQNPFGGISSIFILAGLVVMIAGGILAYYLKQKQKEIK